jgi:type I restriction enzyme R subunit
MLKANRKQKHSELITEENLNEEAAKRYITTSLKREYASENGTELECTFAENESFKSSVFD